MKIGEKLSELRKSKHLSQEEVAEKLNVTRQTISKWETDQSTPDFDKIIPLCELYEISADELLKGEKLVKEEINTPEDPIINEKRAKGICISILLYFISVIWVVVTIPGFNMNPILSVAVFLFIVAIATFIIVYTNLVYKKPKTVKEEKQNTLIKRIDNILSLIVLCIYLIISFVTMAWHLTWIIWIVYGLIMEIIKLVFSIKDDEDE